MKNKEEKRWSYCTLRNRSGGQKKVLDGGSVWNHGGVRGG